MKIDDLLRRLERCEQRLNVLEGKEAAPEDLPPPAPRPKPPSGEFPKMIYRRAETGEIQSMIVTSAAELPERYAESPDDVDDPIEEPAEVAEIPDEPLPADIPANWAELNGNTLIALAKRLPGGEEIRTKEDAVVVIELELERRGDAE